MRLFQNAKYDFIGRRKIAYLISGSVIAAGILAAVFWQVGAGSWLNYGVDFTGGTLVQVRFNEPASVNALREVVTVPGAEITRFGAENEYLIRAPQLGGQEEQVAGEITGLLADRYGAGGFEVVRTEAVGPKIGAELQQRAALAILLSFGLTLVYLAFRFQWRFGVAAVIAVVHDVLITLGFISAFQLEVSLPTIAAVLTIIGYSLNDTIVVFDRARENLKKSGRREEFSDILNRSINETLPRTTLTSGTTVGALLALFIFGGEIIRDFALILIVGIVVGTYSSIFVASPALLEIQRRWGGTKKQRRPAPPARVSA